MGVMMDMVDQPTDGGDDSRLRTLFEHAPGFIAMLHGPDHVFDLANAAYRSLVGEREILGRSVRDALPDVGGQGLYEILDRVYATGEPFLATGMTISLQRTASGPRQQRRLDFMYQPLLTPEGRVVGIFCEGHDATDHWLADDALREKEAALASALQTNRDILDHALDVICSIDAEGHFIAVSKRCEELWGYTAQELEGRRYIDLVHPEDVEATNASALAIMAGTPTQAFQNRYLRKDGTSIPVLWSAVWSESHQRMFATARDLTERLNAEEKLRQAQRMDAVGKLTGGVAHDFNNLLTVVIGGAESMLDTLPSGAPERALAELTLQAGERGAALVSRLLGFARQHPLAPQPVEVAAMVASMEPLIRRAVGAGVELRIALGGGAVNCVVDRVQLESALLNLCVNARDAMASAGGGTLTIETGGINLDKEYTHGDEDFRPGRYIFITVTDSGEGMSPETIDRAFEPFFSTKEITKGSGLGLSTTYGFVKQSGGHIRIVSELGVSTSISLLLPCVSGVDLGECHADTPDLSQPARAAHILVVEDDDLVRSQVDRSLHSLHHRVTSCRNAAEALDILAADSTITLLFTDVVMPGGMNGRQLADHAKLLRPDLQVLFTSGYTEDALIQKGRVIGNLHFIAKPYRRADLARAVSEALGCE